MGSDWESENEAPRAPPPAKKKKWEGEDDDDDEPVSDWEASSSESESDEPAPAPVPVAPPKKKESIKAKLAEKEAAKTAQKRAVDKGYDSDEVLDPREKAKRDKERELAADLNVAKDLLGTTSLGGSKELEALLKFQPRTKEDFQSLSTRIIETVIKQHQGKPLYSSFVEMHVRELAKPLSVFEVRKAASTLTTLANEKQKEQKDKPSGKKKIKPVLGSSKVATRLDTSVYSEALDDDFGTHPDDFM